MHQPSRPELILMNGRFTTLESPHAEGLLTIRLAYNLFMQKPRNRRPCRTGRRCAH